MRLIWVTKTGAATICGITERTLERWLNERPDFPRSSRSGLYLQTAVRSYCFQHGILPVTLSMEK